LVVFTSWIYPTAINNPIYRTGTEQTTQQGFLPDCTKPLYFAVRVAPALLINGMDAPSGFACFYNSWINPTAIDRCYFYLLVDGIGLG
jgi:hypothetical protein